MGCRAHLRFPMRRKLNTMNLKRRHPADEMIDDEYSVVPSMIDETQLLQAVEDRAIRGRGLVQKPWQSMQLQAFPSVEPWLEEDLNILADMGDEFFAEYYMGDQLAATTFAQCRHISSGNVIYPGMEDCERRTQWRWKHSMWAFRGADTPTGEEHQEKLRRTKRTIVGVSKGVVLALVAAVLQGCVTYVHKFDPHESSMLCAHVVSKCAVMQ